MIKKQFATLAVVGTYTGFLMEEKGFRNIHEVMDHLYPGIMTHSLPSVWKKAKEHLEKTIPKLAELPACSRNNFQTVADEALVKFGPTLEVEGPLDDNLDIMTGLEGAKNVIVVEVGE